jgi:hypothetical protein
MKTKKQLTLLAVIILVLTALASCKEADTETPVPKTYTITLKDGALVFVVEYKALPTEEPAYLAYLKTRLEAVVNDTGTTNVDATNNLMTKGGSNHTIIVEYANTLYEGIKWNTETRKFTIHNDWIATASGTDLSGAMIRAAFNAVETE